MAVSRRRDKTYTGPNSVQTDRLRGLDKQRKTPEGRFGRVAPPDAESVRKFIEARLCPWCGGGPYVVLAGHTQRAHAVSGSELRELARLTKAAKICASEHSRQVSERRRGQRLPDIAYERNRGVPRKFSEAGRAVQRAKLAAAHWRGGGTRETATRAGRAAAVKRMQENEPKYREVMRLFRAGLSYQEIGAAVELNPRTVSEVLRREGIEVDGRSRRNTTPDGRRQLTVSLRLAKAATEERAAAIAASRIDRFRGLGGDWEALKQVATEWGLSRKTARQYLIDHGVAVPDGRQAAASRFSDYDLSEMVRLYAEGHSQSAIASRFATSQAYVSALLRRQGVGTRPFARSSRRRGVS